MLAYLNKKKSRIKFVLSCCVSLGAALVMSFVRFGPQLGLWYDVLLGLRQPPPVAGELLLIDTGNGSSPLENTGGSKSGLAGVSEQVLEPETLSSVLLVLNEFKAAALLVQVPVAGFSAGGGKSEGDILLSVNTEFSLIGRNIRNLFNAIRTGSVGPSDSERYVGEVIELSEQGKNRLITSLFNQDGMQVEKTAAAFGKVWQSRDLLLGLIRGGGHGGQQDAAEKSSEAGVEGAATFEGAYRIEGYARVRADRDGRVRRIAPVLLEGFDYFSMFPYNRGYAAQNFLPESRGIPHVVYRMMQDRYPGCMVAYTRSGYIIRIPNQTGGADTIIPLDAQGNLIFERTRPDADFRYLSLRAILEYEEADRTMRVFLGEAETLGFYGGVAPEKNPVFLYDYALSFREDMLEDPAQANRDRWMDARNLYFKNLAEFFDGAADKRNRGIKTEEAAHKFAALLEKYQALMKTRQELARTLASSLCILGYSGGNDPRGLLPVLPNPTDAYTAALLANSLITGRAVRPADSFLIVLASFIAALLVNFCIRASGILRTFFMGMVLTQLIGAAFSFSFIVNGYWIDPLIPLVSCAAGVISSCLSTVAYKSGFIQQYRNTYSPYVSASVLEALIRAEKPLSGETVSARAVIVAVRNPRIAVLEGRERPADASREAVRFQTTVARTFKSAGAVIVGCEYSLVMAAFGSPLQSVNTTGSFGMGGMAEKAIAVVKKMAKLPQAVWYFSLDLGECAFTLSGLSGYTASGQAVLRCRILSALAVRRKARVLLGKALRDHLGEMEPVRRIELGAQKPGKSGMVVYELLLEKTGKK